MLVLGLYFHFRFFLGPVGLKRAWPHRYHPYGSGTSKPNQKVDQLGGPFGSPVISKLCLQLLLSWTPLYGYLTVCLFCVMCVMVPSINSISYQVAGKFAKNLPIYSAVTKSSYIRYHVTFVSYP